MIGVVDTLNLIVGLIFTSFFYIYLDTDIMLE